MYIRKLYIAGCGLAGSLAAALPQAQEETSSAVPSSAVPSSAEPSSAVPSSAASTTTPDPREATGTPGHIPDGTPPEPHNPYPNTGNLTEEEPEPYLPAGGINMNNTPPVYQAMSDFDWQSINLALNQEWIELDLFQEGLHRYPVEDFEDAGLGADDRYLIEFMAEQEIGHATLLSNILGPRAARRCEYQYPFTNVREFVDFCQRLTRFGESGVYGFIEHLNSRAAAQLLLQSITTEARQQMIFRQFQGLFPMPVWFEVGVSQSMAWTLLSPYIVSCPAENPHIAWQNFPSLNITNNPNGTDPRFGPAITHNRPALSYPGREVTFRYDESGQRTGYNGSYVTNSTARGPARFAMWTSQLNTTYTPLYDDGYDGDRTVRAVQPHGKLFSDLNGIVNGTMFVALVDDDIYVTPHNYSMVNQHIVAGPALYQAG